MKASPGTSKAICILGMHRSGTSTVSRAINLLGAYLGEQEDLMPPTEFNPEGYWERKDVFALQERLLAQLKRTWDTSAPLPDGWHLAEEVRPFREELTTLVREKFGGHPLWAWKDPRTCILLALWKDVLEELGVELRFALTVRNPHDVAKSLEKRDGLPLDKGYGIWFNYTLSSLHAMKGTPSAMISYDRFLDEGESELRRCTAALDLPWPMDTTELRGLLGTFLRKDLRHNKSDSGVLNKAPRPVRELDALLAAALQASNPFDAAFFEKVDALQKEFYDYSTFFRVDVEKYESALQSGAQLEEQLHSREKDLNARDLKIGDLHATIENHSRLVKERDEQLHELNLKIGGQQIRMLEQGEQLEERDRLLAEHARMLAERDVLLQEHADLLAERDQQLREKAEQLAERDKLLEERGQRLTDQAHQLAERDRLLQEHAQLLAERDELLQRHAEQLAERDRLLVEHGQQLAERLKQLDNQDKQLSLRDFQLAERDLQLAKRDLELRERDQQLAEQHQQLTDYGKSLNVQVKELSERDSRLAEKDRLLAERVQRLAEQELQMEEQELQLGELNRQLSFQDERLTRLSAELAQSKDLLAKRDRRLAELAQELDGRDYVIAQHDRQLAAQIQEINLKTLLLAERDLQVAKLELKFTQIERDFQITQQRLEQRESELAEFEGKLAEQAQRLSRKKGDLLWRDDRLAQMEEKLAEATQRIAEEQGHVQWRDQRLAEKDQQLAERERECLALRQQASQYDQRAQALAQQLTVRDQEAAQLERVLAQLKQQLAEKEGRIRELLASYSWKASAPLRWAFAIPAFGLSQAKSFYSSYGRMPTIKELPNLIRLASASFLNRNDASSATAQQPAVYAQAPEASVAQAPGELPQPPRAVQQPEPPAAPAAQGAPHDAAPPDHPSPTPVTSEHFTAGGPGDAVAAAPPVIDQYQAWVEVNRWNRKKEERLRERIAQIQDPPLLSVVMPVYNPPLEYLNRAIETVRLQVYGNWELCIADDASSNGEVRSALIKWAAIDPRIKVAYREENGNISRATNSAAALATGSHLVFLDQDDELTPDALGEIALYLAGNPETDVLYTDDDKIDTEGNRFAPQFKPDWSPELLLSYMYLSHIFVVRRALFDEVGGTRVGFEGSQDYDLALRVTEKARHVGHIPLVLYHWRVLPGSTACSGKAKPDSMDAGRRAVQEALDRRGMQGTAYQPEWAAELGAGFFSHRFSLQTHPTVTIIIPTKDQVEVLKRCVESILEKTDYPAYEILVIDNESEKPETIAYLNQVSVQPKVRTIRVSNPEGKFSFAYINNRAAKSSDSDYVLFLNNDTEVLNAQWLTEMMGYAQAPGVGGVGARLFYPDGRIQHAGVLIKFYRGLAGHAFKGITDQEPGYLGYAKVARNYSAVTAACLLTPRSLFLEMGGFDEEHFKVAYNDVDLCGRLLDKGYRLVYTPEARLTHYEGYSRGFCDDPRENANFKEMYFGKKDRYYNPSLSLDNEQFEVWPRSIFTGELGRPLKTLLCAHNLNHEGAPYSQFELTVGLKQAGIIDPTVLSPVDGPLRGLYEAQGIRVIINPDLGCMFDPALYRQRVQEFVAFLRETGAEMVYANTLINYHVIAAAKAAGLPSIWNIRESEPWQYYENLWGRELTEEAARCFTYPYKVIFVAHTTKHCYSAFEGKRNFHVIYNGLNLDRLTSAAKKYDRDKVREELGIGRDELAVLLPGTVCERKGQHDLARAMELLPAATLGRIRCFIVGDWDSPFPYNLELHAIADALPEQAKERLEILPVSAEIFKFYKAADIFVCTSRIESFPRIILEAMAFDLPIVTTPVFGIQEQVQQGVNALFYSPGDPAGLAKGLETLVQDDAMRARFAGNSSHVLRQLETFDEMVGCYATLFAEAGLSVGPRPRMREGVELHPASAAASGCDLKKITFLTTYKDENSQRFRVYNLIEELNRKGIDCAVIKEDFAGSLEAVLDSDLMVAFRVAASPNVRRILSAFKRSGVPTVFDVDDMVFEPESADLLFGLRTLGEEDRKKALESFGRLKETLLTCDYATGTTQPLAARMEGHGKTSFVIPNSINLVQMELARKIRGTGKRGDGKVRIGYFSGTNTHEEDFKEACDALYEVMVAHDNVEFHLVGVLDLDPRFSEFGDRVVRQPLMDYLEMLRYLAQMDLNLAPLEMNNAFTACKSELKIFEAALLGIATVASATASYAACITDGVNGCLAASKDEWRSKLEKLIRDGSLREEIAAHAERDFTVRFAAGNVVEQALKSYGSMVQARRDLKPPRFLVYDDGLSEETWRSFDGQAYANWEAAGAGKATDLREPGDTVLFVGDGVLPQFALYELAQYLRSVDADLFYTDEATLTDGSWTNPHYKPDWSPDLFRNCDYITNFFGVRGALLAQIGTWSSRYDLVLKASELSAKIVHIPKILFYLRRDVTAIDDDALAGHLKRMNLPAAISQGLLRGSRKIDYVLKSTPKISIIIPNKDSREVLEKCISSIQDKSSYRKFEIIVVENGSVEKETFRYYKKISAAPNVAVLKWEKPFHFSAVNNFAAARAKGEILLFLNNDIEVLSPDWLERMLEYATRDDVGCVGAKLYYPDDTVQHGGVTVGLGGVAGHSHKDFHRDADGYFGRLKLVQNVSAVTAACVMVRKDVFQEVGGFDEGYPLAFNDIDLCLKIRKKQYLIVWTPFAELYHHESKTRGLDTTPEKQKRFQSEVSYFMQKWSDSVLQGDPYYNVNLTLRSEDFALNKRSLSLPGTWSTSQEVAEKLRETFLRQQVSEKVPVAISSYFAEKAACGVCTVDYLKESFLDQERTLRELTAAPPEVVWLDSAARLSSLMSYRIYRWLIKNDYRYYEAAGFHFMMRGDLFDQAGLSPLTENEELAGLSRLFHLEDLQWLPTMWGSSPVLRDMLRPSGSEPTFTIVQQNNVAVDETGWAKIQAQQDPYLVWQVSPPIDGTRHDFVKIELEGRPSQDGQCLSQFFWAGAGEGLAEERQFTFVGRMGNSVLIPVGSHPRWLRTTAIDTIRFDIDNYFGEFKIGSISLWSLPE